MFKGIKQLIPVLILTFTGCITEDNIDNTPLGNFDELWRIIDEKYCYFDYKGIDWDRVYDTYSQQIRPSMSENDLQMVFGNMLNELKDGHVNLFSSEFTLSGYNFYDGYPLNYYSYIVEEYYLKLNYRITGGVRYQILKNNIGYMYVENFTEDIGNRNLDHILTYLKDCDGIIIDVRNNGGGAITNANRLASRFSNKKVLTGYIAHKTGKGHQDFSKPQPIYLSPSGNVRYLGKLAVLTNRQTFSAGNEFVNIMTNLPQVTTIGGLTGGGSGLPFHSELPNGWGVRFSTSPLFNSNMEHVENGILPDIEVTFTDEDITNERDPLLDTALELLSR